MMFMQFFIWGSWSVTLGLVMTRYEMAADWRCVLRRADRLHSVAVCAGDAGRSLFASQKVMAVMHLAGAAILWFVPRRWWRRTARC
jgi:hypothetical protein